MPTPKLSARATWICFILVAATALATLPARAQSTNDHPILVAPTPGGVNNGTNTTTAPPFGNGIDVDQIKMMHNMMKQRSSLRQKEIVDDTNRLLDLAKQLKEAVDKTGQNELSVSVVNTASEMEKLAKTVKEKMRDGQ